MTRAAPTRAFGLSLDRVPAFLRPWLRRFRIDFNPKTPPPLAAVLVAIVNATYRSGKR